MYSQNRINDSLYNYWAKRGVLESTFAYMQDYQNIKDLNNREDLGFKKYKKKYISKIDSVNLIILDSVAFFLKQNSWKITSDSIFLKLKEKYEKGDNLNQSFFDIKIDTSYINWHHTTKGIINSYNDAVLNLKNQSNRGSIDNSNINKSNRNKSNFEKENFILLDFLLYVFLILIGFILGAFFIYNKIKNCVRKILEVEYDKYNSESTNKYFLDLLRIIDQLKNKKNDYKKKCEKSNEYVNKLKEDIKNLKSVKSNSNIGHIEKESSAENVNSNTLKKDIKESEEEKEVEVDNTYVFEDKSKPKSNLKLFFTIPQEDGSFKLINSDKASDGKKYYKVEYEENSQEGTLFFLPSDKDIKAIGLLEQFLEPVCDIDNIMHADTASKIELLKEGKVYLENEKWIIDPKNKVKIRLC